MFGVAVTTSSICVASRCPWVQGGVGAIATQNVTDPRLGPRGLDLLASGLSAPEAMRRLMANAPHPEYRQVIMIDRDGATAAHAGAKTLGTNGIAPGADCIAAGNLLSNPDVPAAMVRSFVANGETHLAERLLLALEAGLVAGGEVGPVKSAGLLVVHEHIWPLVDLRVDWDEENPLSGLRRLWERFQPQMLDYVTRALDPACRAISSGGAWRDRAGRAEGSWTGRCRTCSPTCARAATMRRSSPCAATREPSPPMPTWRSVRRAWPADSWRRASSRANRWH
jgi:uncharacterized Ntn-hydrolase superfamily protein